MDTVLLFKLIALAVLLALGAAAALYTTQQEVDKGGHRREVLPGTALVVRNYHTGEIQVLFPGNHILVPDQDEVLQEVSLRNEPFDPPEPTTVTTADQVEIKVQWVYKTFQLSSKADDIKLAVLEIDYNRRQEYVTGRVTAALREVTGRLQQEELFPKIDGKTTQNRERTQEVEDKINDHLFAEVEECWGIMTGINIQRLIPPEELEDAAHKAEVAEKEGEATAKRAEAAGVLPWFMAALETFERVFGKSHDNHEPKKGGRK